MPDFQSDSVAGTVVLFITVPQAIAYAYLAGMPPQTGLYAAMVALVFYAAFGSSKALAVGPTAIVAMMAFETASAYAGAGTDEYILTVVQLSFVTGFILLFLRIVNFGSVISFLSHAVVTGFISAAAILIISNQFPLMIGLESSPDKSLVGVYGYLYADFGLLNEYVVAIALGAVAVLVFCRTLLSSMLLRLGLSESVADNIVKSAPMFAVVLGVIVVQSSNFDVAAGVPIVGEIPSQLPSFTLVILDWPRLQSLTPSALLIAMVIFMESTSIGTAVAVKSRDKIDANHELIGLGAANIGSSFVGGFPVAGSLARTIVNYSSGAVSPVASVITAVLVLLTLLLFASAFYYLPTGVLSAIIVVSAWQLIDVQAIKKIFSFNPTDAVTFTCTFVAVLILGVESGVLFGIVVSFILLIRSSSKPHIAFVGRVGDSEHFRNVDRYDVTTSKRVLALRVDESFYFVNTRYVESFVLTQIAESKEIEHVLLICSGANFVDTSGLEMLEALSENLQEVAVTLHLAEVKGPVMDKLKETGFYKNMAGQVYFTTDIAMKELAGI